MRAESKPIARSCSSPLLAGEAPVITSARWEITARGERSLLLAGEAPIITSQMHEERAIHLEQLTIDLS